MAEVIAGDLRKVASSNPNERLPKEEQIRSRVFAHLLLAAQVVCVERGYVSVDERSSSEVDLWWRTQDGQAHWLEIKRCWHVSGPGWNNKAGEQHGTWTADLKKLAAAPLDDVRVFLLTGFFDFEPLTDPVTTRSPVVTFIRLFQPGRRVASHVAPFSWRTSPVSHLGIWFWRWAPGDAIAI